MSLKLKYPLNLNHVFIPGVILHDKEIDPLEKIILSMVIAFNKYDRQFFISNTNLASIFNVKINEIRSSIDHLVELGYLKIKDFDKSLARELISNLTDDQSNFYYYHD